METLFQPYDFLASQLLPAVDLSSDGAHDLSHIVRVWRNALQLQAEEGGDCEIIAAAVLLHDCVYIAKNSPDRGRASRLAAEKATTVVEAIGWHQDRVAAVAHAIKSHSFTAQIEPLTLEARIVQDADRLDAIGAVGVARCFYTAGRMNSALYHATDPLGKYRVLDDSRFALDHFPRKLFTLAEGFKTPTGQTMALQRQSRLRRFYEEFAGEVS